MGEPQPKLLPLSEQLHFEHVMTLNRLTGTDWDQARDKRATLQQSLLSLGSYPTFADAMEDIGSRTVIPIIAGGVASRWEKSFATEEAAAVLDDKRYEVTKGKPRGFTRVPNVLPRTIWPEETIPVFGYTLWQTRDIPGARRFVIHPEDATTEDLTEMQRTAQMLGLDVAFRPQRKRANNPKPSGHADALAQHVDLLEGSDFVLPQFVSDASSPATIKDTLLTLAVLNYSGFDVDVVVPTVKMDSPKYSVFIDANGLIRKMGHAKLLGERSLRGTDTALSIAGSQIGIYPFTTEALWEELEATYATYLNERSYVFLPGHENGVNEFAIDDAILSLAAKGRVRQLAVANDYEILHSAKTVPELPHYVQMMTRVLVENGIDPQI